MTLDIQAIIDECYRKSRYGQSIDYREELDPPLNAADAAWAKELLQQAGRLGS